MSITSVNVPAAQTADSINDPLEADLASGWRQQAKCAEQGADVFFSAVPGASARVRRICAGCPVIRECALFGVEQSPEDPIELTGRWASYRVDRLRVMRAGKRQGWDDLMAGQLPKRA